MMLHSSTVCYCSQDMEQLEAVQKKKELELIAVSDYLPYVTVVSVVPGQVRLDNIKLQYRVQKCENELKQKVL